MSVVTLWRGRSHNLTAKSKWNKTDDTFVICVWVCVCVNDNISNASYSNSMSHIVYVGWCAPLWSGHSGVISYEKWHTMASLPRERRFGKSESILHTHTYIYFHFWSIIIYHTMGKKWWSGELSFFGINYSTAFQSGILAIQNEWYYLRETKRRERASENTRKNNVSKHMQTVVSLSVCQWCGCQKRLRTNWERNKHQRPFVEYKENTLNK